MRPRSPVRNWAEYCLALAVVKTLEWMPAVMAYPLARGTVRLFILAATQIEAHRGTEPDHGATGFERGGAAENRGWGFASIARVEVTFAKFPRIRKDNVDGWIRCEGAEHFAAGLRAGEG